MATISGCRTSSDCFTSDSLEQLEIFNMDNNRYSLFLRISGFQEKEAFYELYKGIPVFDKCGRPDIYAVSTIHIDTSQGSVSKLIVDEEKLDLIYSADDRSSIGFKDVIIVIKKR